LPDSPLEQIAALGLTTTEHPAQQAADWVAARAAAHPIRDRPSVTRLRVDAEYGSGNHQIVKVNPLMSDRNPSTPAARPVRWPDPDRAALDCRMARWSLLSRL
jgi:hypothetical protein